MGFDLLVKMQPSRKRRKEGEVFVIQPFENTFDYGKVIRTKLPSKNLMVEGMNLIYIYNQHSKEVDIPEELNPNKLLIPPQIVNNQGWLKGYFQTVDIQSVLEEEKNIDFGFWDIKIKGYVDEEGERLDHVPAIHEDFGIGSYGSVGYSVKKVFDLYHEGDY
ncbi:immunity 26/phosphotriesterase HocA family protein [Aquisalibacillus elongatus]|uniref:Immunity protein 26 of polymorphic toxin system n=1 Tax=Aquisalibacillus elongatus TaxID=485577 RepID=A0A3N5BF19_9BACI|nr:immunity 26/phosphotriesterase HocA family protein [Aquisalibacillus elongatus]RPF55479.1 immunity protein 26 of polymorphic toxin system [Aquisalibacillus elongatus]